MKQRNIFLIIALLSSSQLLATNRLDSYLSRTKLQQKTIVLEQQNHELTTQLNSMQQHYQKEVEDIARQLNYDYKQSEEENVQKLLEAEKENHEKDIECKEILSVLQKREHEIKSIQKENEVLIDSFDKERKNLILQQQKDIKSITTKLQKQHLDELFERNKQLTILQNDIISQGKQDIIRWHNEQLEKLDLKYNTKISDLTNNIEVTQKEVTAKDVRIAVLQNESKHQYSQLKELQNNMRQNINEKQSLLHQYKLNQEQKLSDTKQLDKQYKQELKTIVAKINDNYQKDMEYNNKRIAALNSDKYELEKELQQIKKEKIESTKKDKLLIEKQVIIRQHENKFTELDKQYKQELKTIVAKINDNYQRDMGRNNKKTTSLNKEIFKLEKELKQIKEEKINRSKSLKNQNDSLIDGLIKQELDKLAAKLNSDYNKELNDKDKQLGEKQGIIKQHENKFAELDKQYKQELKTIVAKINNNYQKDMLYKDKQITSLTKDLIQKKNYEQEKSKLEESLKQSKHEKDALAKKNDLLSAKLATVKQSLITQDIPYKKSRNKHIKSRTVIQEKEALINKLIRRELISMLANK